MEMDWSRIVWVTHRKRKVFEEEVRLNPADEQGAKYLLRDIKAGRTWNALKGGRRMIFVGQITAVGLGQKRRAIVPTRSCCWFRPG